MLSSEEMKKAKDGYLLAFTDDEIYLVKSKGDVKITPQRAREWIEAGIKDLDCRSKERMLQKVAEIEEEFYNKK